MCYSVLQFTSVFCSNTVFQWAMTQRSYSSISVIFFIWNAFCSHREKDEPCEDQKCSGSSSVDKQKKTREKLIQEKQRIQVNRNTSKNVRVTSPGSLMWMPSNVFCASTEGDVWPSEEAGGASGAEQSCGGAAGAGWERAGGGAAGGGGARAERLWCGSTEADGSSAGGHDDIRTPRSDHCLSTSRDHQVRSSGVSQPVVTVIRDEPAMMHNDNTSFSLCQDNLVASGEMLFLQNEQCCSLQ